MEDNFSGLAGTERVAADAATRSLAIEIIERPKADSLDEAAKLLGIPSSSIVKTLVIKKHNGDYLLALVPGGRKISWPKLRTLVGVNKLSLPDAVLALEATGYQRGTITPLGAASAWPLYADESITGKDIYLGAGAHGFSARVASDALIASYHAIVADITDIE